MKRTVTRPSNQASHRQSGIFRPVSYSQFCDKCTMRTSGTPSADRGFQEVWSCGHRQKECILISERMKRIFVGSASADKALANTLAEKLSVNGVIGECWTDAFPLGLLTFEALERMLRRCVGAVFIVSSD